MGTTKRKPDFKCHMYEKEAWARGELICGIDEVGRSCFAGPVVAAAAILRPGAKHRLLKDSKLLTPEEREIVYRWLKKNSVSCVGIASHRVIDKINIYYATLVAMKRAVIQLVAQAPARPALIVIDAMPLRMSLDIPIIAFCNGEKKSASIAAASIIAKVTRDALMSRIDQAIPGYAWSSNKGYGTVVHRKALRQSGRTILHRVSFLKNFTGNSDPVISE